MEDRIEVLVVAPAPVVRRGLGLTAAEAPRLDVVASVGSVRAALAVLRARRVGVAIVDDALRVRAGVDPVRLLQRGFADLGVVVVAADPLRVDDAPPVRVLGLDADTDELAAAVIAAARRASGSAAAMPVLRAAPAVGDPVLDALKPIERRVLELLADGLSNREIATLVGLSERMVKKYVTAVFAALGVARRTEAAVVYTTRRAAAGAGPSPSAGPHAPAAAQAIAFPPDVTELAADLEERRAIAEELQQQLAVAERELVRLREEHGRYRAVYDDMPVPHLLTDAYGVVTAADRAMASLLGVPAEVLRGTALATLVPPGDQRTFRERLARLAGRRGAGADGGPRAPGEDDLAARTFRLEVDGRLIRVVATVGAGDPDRHVHWTVPDVVGPLAAPDPGAGP